MASTTATLACRFCGGRRSARETHCGGCGAQLELPDETPGTTARLLEMSTQLNRLLRQTAAAERDRSRKRLRAGLAVAVTGFVLLGVVSTFLSSVAGHVAGVEAYPTAASARQAAEARRNEVAYQMMLDQGMIEPAR